MVNILCSPSKYVQGTGEMKKLGEYAQKYGKKATIIITIIFLLNISFTTFFMLLL